MIFVYFILFMSQNNLNLYVKVIWDRISSDIPNLDDVINCNILGAKRRKVVSAIDLLWPDVDDPPGCIRSLAEISHLRKAGPKQVYFLYFWGIVKNGEDDLDNMRLDFPTN